MGDGGGVGGFADGGSGDTHAKVGDADAGVARPGDGGVANANGVLPGVLYNVTVLSFPPGILADFPCGGAGKGGRHGCQKVRWSARYH